MSEPYEGLARHIRYFDGSAGMSEILATYLTPRMEQAARKIADKIDPVKMPLASEILQILRETIGK